MNSLSSSWSTCDEIDLISLKCIWVKNSSTLEIFKYIVHLSNCYVLSNRINLYLKENCEIPGPDLKTYNFWKIGAFLVLDTFF